MDERLNPVFKLQMGWITEKYPSQNSVSAKTLEPKTLEYSNYSSVFARTFRSLSLWNKNSREAGVTSRDTAKK